MEITEVLTQKYVYRLVKQNEITQTAQIEQICFGKDEACTYSQMRERIQRVPELFLVVIDFKKRKIAGFISGIATNDEIFRDEFFSNASLHDPSGENIMLLGLEVLPEYRNQGLASELMNRYMIMMHHQKRKRIILTCAEEKVRMYEKFGFIDHGIGGSRWGGRLWHEMSRAVEI